MMTLTEERTNRPIISHYTPGKMVVGENAYDANLLITPSGKVITWSIQNINELDAMHCQEMLAYQPEIVIIGTGNIHQLPPLSVIHFFSNHRMGIEIMSTSAACRTYNILVLEDRHVLAGFIMS